MAKYLVTGGAGFIGSNLARYILGRGHEVVVLDNFATGKRENLTEIAEQITLVEGDIRDGDAVDRAMAGCCAVFHEAALGSVPRSVEDPVTSHDVNVNGTVHGAGGRPAGGDQADHLRRVEQRVRQPGRVAQARGHGPQADQPLRGQQDRLRGLHAGLRRELRAGDALPAVLQRLRPAAGPVRGVRGGHPRVRQLAC